MSTDKVLWTDADMAAAMWDNVLKAARQARQTGQDQFVGQVLGMDVVVKAPSR